MHGTARRTMHHHTHSDYRSEPLVGSARRRRLDHDQRQEQQQRDDDQLRRGAVVRARKSRCRAPSGSRSAALRRTRPSAARARAAASSVAGWTCDTNHMCSRSVVEMVASTSTARNATDPYGADPLAHAVADLQHDGDRQRSRPRPGGTSTTTRPQRRRRRRRPRPRSERAQRVEQLGARRVTRLPDRRAGRCG